MNETVKPSQGPEVSYFLKTGRILAYILNFEQNSNLSNSSQATSIRFIEIKFFCRVFIKTFNLVLSKKKKTARIYIEHNWSLL